MFQIQSIKQPILLLDTILTYIKFFRSIIHLQYWALFILYIISQLTKLLDSKFTVFIKLLRKVKHNKSLLLSWSLLRRWKRRAQWDAIPNCLVWRGSNRQFEYIIIRSFYKISSNLYRIVYYHYKNQTQMSNTNNRSIFWILDYKN